MSMVNTEPNVDPLGRYSIKETCAALGIGRTTLHRLTKRGILVPKYEKYMMRPRFRGRDILAFWRAEI